MEGENREADVLDVSPNPHEGGRAIAQQCGLAGVVAIQRRGRGARTRKTPAGRPTVDGHTPGSHAQPVTTDVGGVLLASWTRMSWKPASSSQALYDSSVCTPPLLVRVISPAA
jgi:hypothetical protein